MSLWKSHTAGLAKVQRDGKQHWPDFCRTRVRPPGVGKHVMRKVIRDTSTAGFYLTHHVSRTRSTTMASFPRQDKPFLHQGRPFLRQGTRRPIPLVATFSILAHDPRTGGTSGIAGRASSWRRRGGALGAQRVGAIATQSWANTGYGLRRPGPAGFRGSRPQEVVDRLTAAGRAGQPPAAWYCGRAGRSRRSPATNAFSLGRAASPGRNFAAQGNILVSGPDRPGAWCRRSWNSRQSGRGELADHLVQALAAGQAAGGDSRGDAIGRPSSSPAPGRAYSGLQRPLRRPARRDTPSPINELRRILELHHLYFSDPAEDSLLPIRGRGVARTCARCCTPPATCPRSRLTRPTTRPRRPAFDNSPGRKTWRTGCSPGAQIGSGWVLKYLRGLVEEPPEPRS